MTDIIWGDWSASSLGRALPPGKAPPAPIVQDGGWAPEPVWTHTLQEKSFCLCRGSNIDHPVVQSVVRHYTDGATPAPVCILFNQNEWDNFWEGSTVSEVLRGEVFRDTRKVENTGLKPWRSMEAAYTSVPTWPQH